MKNKLKTVAIIPARKNSQRLPQKMLLLLQGKMLIRHTYENIQAMQLFDEVWVATDSIEIKNEIESIGGKVFVSKKNHESGTDRIAELAANINADIVVNIQGDEPFVKKQHLMALLHLFEKKEVNVGSLKMEITDEKKINDPNCVKVVCTPQGKALYFSRNVIPFARDTNVDVCYYKHIGVYAYRKNSLLEIASTPVSPLEAIEKLENLRMLENNIDIYLAQVDDCSISIDTEEDFKLAEKILSDKS